MTLPATSRFGRVRPPVAPVNTTESAASQQLPIAGESSDEHDLPGGRDHRDDVGAEPVQPEIPTAGEVPDVADHGSTAADSNDTVAAAPDTSTAETSAADSDAPPADTAPAAASTARTDKPKRSRRPRKTPATQDAAKTLVVKQNGEIITRSPDIVIVDLDAAHDDNLSSADVLAVLATLKDVGDDDFRQETADTLLEVIRDKALD